MGELKLPTLYFGYGSNLWIEQMNARCPGNRFLGTARLNDWRWVINTRGYANVVAAPGFHVWALVYSLAPSDEAALDGYEGVPHSYVKRTLPVEFHGTLDLSALGYPVQLGRTHEKEIQLVDALVYVDIERVVEGSARSEYVSRMNSGVKDALAQGIPESYIQTHIRPKIPPQ